MCNNVYAEVQELLCGNFGQQSLRVTLPFAINLIPLMLMATKSRG